MMMGKGGHISSTFLTGFVFAEKSQIQATW
jgi:hypothetical protein